MVIEDGDNIIDDLLFSLGQEVGRREYRFRYLSAGILLA